ncbi:MAG TPA: glycosyltransferase [Vicinamibacteria bacterium]
MTTTSPIDLSIVIECTTGEITGRCDTAANLAEWLAQARALPVRSEILVVAPRLVRAPDGGAVEIRCLEVPGAGYYALKNAGAAAARGEIVLFTDVDCRPGAAYLDTLLETFRGPATACVAGRSLYDGPGVLTRLNSAHSFGDLQRAPGYLDRGMVVSHNVAVRRSALRERPWGPNTGRVGGDGYFCDALRAAGHRIRLEPGLVIHHEDISYSLRGTLERHLREHLLPVRYGTARQRFSAAWTVASVLALRPLLRLKRIVQAGPRIGIGVRHWPAALLVNAGYWVFDVACVSAVLTVPRLRRHWLRFVYGV